MIKLSTCSASLLFGASLCLTLGCDTPVPGHPVQPSNPQQPAVAPVQPHVQPTTPAMPSNTEAGSKPTEAVPLQRAEYTAEMKILEQRGFAMPPRQFGGTFDNALEKQLTTVQAVTFSDEDVAWLREHFPNLEEIRLLQAQVTDAGVAKLVEFPNLKKLDLAGTKITDESLKQVAAACPKLERLDVSGTQTTDAGLAALASMENLKTLVAQNVYVTKKGVDALKQALPNCRISANPQK